MLELKFLYRRLNNINMTDLHCKADNKCNPYELLIVELRWLPHYYPSNILILFLWILLVYWRIWLQCVGQVSVNLYLVLETSLLKFVLELSGIYGLNWLIIHPMKLCVCLLKMGKANYILNALNKLNFILKEKLGYCCRPGFFKSVEVWLGASSYELYKCNMKWTGSHLADINNNNNKSDLQTNEIFSLFLFYFYVFLWNVKAMIKVF